MYNKMFLLKPFNSGLVRKSYIHLREVNTTILTQPEPERAMYLNILNYNQCWGHKKIVLHIAPHFS